MATSHDKDLGRKTWNNDQQNGNLNEGFSGENLPDDYNPAKTAKEKNWDTNESLSRANEIYDEKLHGKEDHNYDSPQRYASPSHRGNQENRGNMELDE